VLLLKESLHKIAGVLTIENALDAKGARHSIFHFYIFKPKNINLAFSAMTANKDGR